MTFETATSAGHFPGTPFTAHMDAPVPRSLREEADAMSYESFVAQYAPSSGPLRLRNWVCTDAHRPATRLGPQVRNYQATLAIGSTISTSSAAASGPIAALTAMLYDKGIAVEMTDFHQLPAGEHTATFIRGCDGGRCEWAMGLADDPTQSALDAMIACANRLLAAGPRASWGQT